MKNELDLAPIGEMTQSLDRIEKAKPALGLIKARRTIYVSRKANEAISPLGTIHKPRGQLWGSE